MFEVIMRRVAVGFVVVFGVFMLYTMLVWLPIHLSHERDCYEKGFPEVKTTVGLQGYCMNIDGAVTGKVEKL